MSPFFLIIVGIFAFTGVVCVASVIRFIRAPKDSRLDVIAPKSHRRVFAWISGGLCAIGLIVGVVFFFISGSMPSVQAAFAAHSYLQKKFGGDEACDISLNDHVAPSKTPTGGAYEVKYTYGKRTGTLLVEYTEIDGKFAFKVTPKD